nr:hypothetical protein [Tanacetum cinerariifolium]
MSSDSTLSAVTYTLISSDSDTLSWGIPHMNADEPQSPEFAPLSPDYVPGLEEPEPDYVPEPVYMEYLTPSDDDIPIKYQPLPVDALPTTLSPGYIADSDPEKDLEEDPEDDPGEAPTNYPADGGDEEDGEESFRDEVDDEDDEEVFEEEDDDEEEKEHLAPADSSIVPIDDHVPLAEETEPFEIDESAPTPSSPRLRRARISVQPQTPMEDVLEANVLPRKRLCLIAPTPRFKFGESLAAAAKQPRFDVTHATDYGFVDTVDATPRHPMTREHIEAVEMAMIAMILEVAEGKSVLLNVARAYTARPGEKKVYGGSKPLFPKCNYHYDGQCAPRCNKCKKVGHLDRDCRGVAANANTQKVVTCFKCGVQEERLPKVKEQESRKSSWEW